MQPRARASSAELPQCVIFAWAWVLSSDVRAVVGVDVGVSEVVGVGVGVSEVVSMGVGVSKVAVVDVGVGVDMDVDVVAVMDTAEARLCLTPME